MCQFTLKVEPGKRILTAVEASGGIDAIGTVCHSAPNLACVTPHQLTEVAPSGAVGRVVVRVLEFLLVPSLDHLAGRLEPCIVLRGSGSDCGEIAAAAVLTWSMRVVS